jgi:hypothetical protein
MSAFAGERTETGVNQRAGPVVPDAAAIEAAKRGGEAPIGTDLRPIGMDYSVFWQIFHLIRRPART